jgi:hypothetical protein
LGQAGRSHPSDILTVRHHAVLHADVAVVQGRRTPKRGRPIGSGDAARHDGNAADNAQKRVGQSTRSGRKQTLASTRTMLL